MINLPTFMRLTHIIKPDTYTDQPHEQNDFLMLIDQWLKSLYRENYSTNTILAYQASLYRFCAFVTKNRTLQGNWQACEQKQLALFFSGRLESGQKISSVKQELSAVNKFYQYAIAQNLTQSNPAATYRLKSQPRPLPIISDVDLINQLLDQPIPCDKNLANIWLRDKAMFELMYSSGLRLSELVNLDMGDVDISAKTVRVVGKGNKMRIVPVGSQAITAITAYLPVREHWQKNHAQNETQALFISQKGGRISQRAVQLRLKACAKTAGISQNLHPHILRHCFASHMLSASGDLRAIQEMLGHSNINTTQIYTQVDFGSLSKTYDKTHPRAFQKNRQIDE